MNPRHLTWLLFILFFGCAKNDPAPVSISEQPFSFTARYDSVVTCTGNSTYPFSFYITVGSGDIGKNKLNCSISGLPPGVTASPSSMIVGHLLGGVFMLNVAGIPAGTYPFQFTVQSSVYGVQVHKMLLKVVLPPDHAPQLAGTYAGSSDYCDPAGVLHNYSSTVSVDSAYKVKISNVGNLGGSIIVNAYVSDIIKIPRQDIGGGYTIWGSGTYGHDDRPGMSGYYQLVINDTLVQGVDTEKCIFHLMR